MADLIRGTTPKLVFTSSNDLDLTILREIWFTIQQRSSGVELTYTLSDDKVKVNDETKTIMVHMSQEETLSFNPEFVEIQIRAVDGSGESYATDVFKVHMDRILKGGVISA